MKKDENNGSSYWTNLILPAGAGLLTKEAVIGHFYSRGNLPSVERTQQTFIDSLHDVGDTLPRYDLGKPGLISTGAGLVVASGLYLLFHRPRNRAVVMNAEHEGVIAQEQLKR